MSPVIPTHQNTVQTSILLNNGFLKIKLTRTKKKLYVMQPHSQVLSPTRRVGENPANEVVGHAF